MMLDDKITIALGGGIQSRKELIAEMAEKYKDILLTCLEGNYWVPPRLTVVKEEQDAELFEKYSADPGGYSFEFQMSYMASRLKQQTVVDEASGVVILGQPLEVDRHIYAEANKDSIGRAFPTYEKVYRQVSRRVPPPDIRIYCQTKEEDLPFILDRVRRYGKPGEKKFLQDSSYLLKNIQLNEKFYGEVRGPVITIDATDLAFEAGDPDHFKGVFEKIAREIREHQKPLSLDLDAWEAIDHNSARKATRVAREQLRRYLAAHPTLISFAGLVGIGKTGFTEFLEDELDIRILRELGDKNLQIDDELLDKFLWEPDKYCYELQEHLLPKRTNARREACQGQWATLAEDRTIEEDLIIFWPLFQHIGYLTEAQVDQLQEKARAIYAGAPQSDLMIKLLKPAQECRTRILGRGRPAEIKMWTLDRLQFMENLYPNFFEWVKKLGLHDGPTLDFDLKRLDTNSDIHKGYLFQEMHHSLLRRAGII